MEKNFKGKVVTRMMPVDVIIFEDGTEADYADVCNDIWDMDGNDITDFYCNGAYDNAVYQFIVGNEKFNDTVGRVFDLSRNLIRIEWKNNHEFVSALLDELTSMKESGTDMRGGENNV